MRISKLFFSSWSSVGLTMASSSCRLRRKPLRTDWRCRETGTKRIGARCAESALSASVHRSRPMARYKVLAPPSSRPVRAALKMESRLPSRASGATLASSSLLARASMAMSSTGVRPPRLVWTCATRGSAPSMRLGSGRILNSEPSDRASSMPARSGATNCSVDLVGLKFSSRFRSVRSSSFDFHFESRPSGVSSVGRSSGVRNSGSSSGSSGVGSIATGTSVASVSTRLICAVREGSGLI